MTTSFRSGRVPVSTVRTGCIPFNRRQKSGEGYRIGENPVKDTGFIVAIFEEALDRLRLMRNPGWRNYGTGNTGSAHKSIGWITMADAERLLDEPNDQRRVELFRNIESVFE